MGPKWIELHRGGLNGQNGPNETELNLIGLKWAKLDLGGSKCVEWNE